MITMLLFMRLLMLAVLTVGSLGASAEAAIKDLDDDCFPSLASAKAVYDLSKKESARVSRLLAQRAAERSDPSRFPSEGFIIFPEYRKRFWRMPSGMCFELIYEDWPAFYLALCMGMKPTSGGSSYKAYLQRFTNVRGRFVSECVERHLTVRRVSDIDPHHTLELSEAEWDYMQSTAYLRVPEGFFAPVVAMGRLQFQNIVSGARFIAAGRSFSAIAYSGCMADGEVQFRSIFPNRFSVWSRSSRVDSWRFIGAIAFAATSPSKMDAPLERLLRIRIPAG